MPEISVEYEVLLTVRVDTDSDKISSVYAHVECFNDVVPLQIYNAGYDESLPEYLDPEHPIAKKAAELAESIKPRVPDVAILWEKR